MSAVRPNSRLEVDDEDFCKWCGKDISGVREHLPDDEGEIDLCGSCEGNRWKLKAKAVRKAEENHGQEVHPKELDEPDESWDLSRELWYNWSAEVAAQYKALQEEQSDV